MSPEQIRERVRCCACGGMLRRGTINMVGLEKIATWKYPVAGNFVTGESGRAVAIVCDGCVRRKKEPTRAVEFRSASDDKVEVHYHRLETLMDPAPANAEQH